jgi:hypothetical protein
MIVEAELPKLGKFREFLRSEDKEVFDDLLNQCRLYTSYAGSMASVVKEIPLIISMLFAQRKRLIELEKELNDQRRQNLSHGNRVHLL